MRCRRVIKLGGSLLGSDDLQPRFFRWYHSLPPARDLLIVGGGLLANGVREYAARFATSDETAHQLCFECMSINAQIIAEAFQLRWTDSLTETERSGLAGLIMFDPRSFLAEVEPTLEEPLPRDWTVTSDSIAARLAGIMRAELILLKSVESPSTNWDIAAAQGYVDEYFPQAIRGLSSVSAVTLVNH